MTSSTSTSAFSVAGWYLGGTQSLAVPATLESEGRGVVRLLAAERALELPQASLEFSERLGSVPRRCVLPDGSCFETADNDGVDRLLALERTVIRGDRLAVLEAKWGVALAALAAVLVIGFVFVRYGVPTIANVAARVTPPSVDSALGIQLLEILDRTLLDPSAVAGDRQEQLRERFAGMAESLDEQHAYELEFRSAPAIGPNAFALPSGIVVMTDELVELAEHDDELAAILAHEIGHVRGRHALRQLLQSAGVAAIAAAVLGDVSSLSAVVSGIPVLIQAKNSRDFEREADAFAKGYLASAGIAESRFDDILCRLATKHGERFGLDEAPDFFATHPSAVERARCEPAPAEAEPE